VYGGTVESVSADKTEYVVHNAGYNGVQHTGDQLCVEFQGHGEHKIFCNGKNVYYYNIITYLVCFLCSGE
jgi:hypothetical protein